MKQNFWAPSWQVNKLLKNILFQALVTSKIYGKIRGKTKDAFHSILQFF